LFLKEKGCCCVDIFDGDVLSDPDIQECFDGKGNRE
jgi:hypothetical protein